MDMNKLECTETIVPDVVYKNTQSGSDPSSLAHFLTSNWLSELYDPMADVLETPPVTVFKSEST